MNLWRKNFHPPHIKFSPISYRKINRIRAKIFLEIKEKGYELITYIHPTVVVTSGIKIGENYFVGYSPEREDPGNKEYSTKTIAKVVSGYSKKCLELTKALYDQIVDTTVSVSSLRTAEMTKILENIHRAVNIGLVNEIALIANRLKVDIWEVIDAAATKPFGFMKFIPGPGLGGHCIPVDPHYLSWKMRTLNYKTRFIDLASEINAEMPLFVADKVREVLNRIRQPLNGSSVLLLGVAYKSNIGDIRESPALDVMRLLQMDGAEVKYHDPYVPNLVEQSSMMTSEVLTDEVFHWADVVVILTDHDDFDYGRIFAQAKTLIDTRHAISRAGVIVDRGDSWIVKG